MSFPPRAFLAPLSLDLRMGLAGLVAPPLKPCKVTALRPMRFWCPSVATINQPLRLRCSGYLACPRSKDRNAAGRKPGPAGGDQRQGLWIKSVFGHENSGGERFGGVPL